MDPPEMTRRSVQRDLSVKMFLSPPIFRAYREAAVNPASKIREENQPSMHGMVGAIAHRSGKRALHPSVTLAKRKRASRTDFTVFNVACVLRGGSIRDRDLRKDAMTAGNMTVEVPL
jgi:hypothetical protein